MANTREKRYTAAFKARISLEAAKQTRTLFELSRALQQVHPVQVGHWKKQQLVEGVESLFGDDRHETRGTRARPSMANSTVQIGQLKCASRLRRLKRALILLQEVNISNNPFPERKTA